MRHSKCWRTVEGSIGPLENGLRLMARSVCDAGAMGVHLNCRYFVTELGEPGCYGAARRPKILAAANANTAVTGSPSTTMTVAR
jgi:hypothetical protein